MTSPNTADERVFFDAVNSGDVEQVRRLVSASPRLFDACDARNFGATPLTSASFAGRREMVEALLDLGADPDRRSDWAMGPWSPLHCAAYRHDRDLMEYLLSRGATMDVHAAAGLGRVDDVERLLDVSPERVVEPGGDGCHPIHFADNEEVARTLLDRGAAIDGRCLDHYSTPAQYLCHRRPEVARYLFSVGAAADVFSASLAGANDVLKKLIAKDDSLVHARINQSFFPSGPEYDVHNILTFVVGMDATPLHAAAFANQRDTIGILLEQGASVDIRGGYDEATPLHSAAWHNCLNSAIALVENGADIDARSGKLHNNSPAGWAIVAGSADVFEYLIKRGATRLSWFADDAREAIAGRFDNVSRAEPEKRQRILALLHP